MSETQIRIDPIHSGKPLQDSTSQVSRATLGLREMLLRGVFHPGERIAEIPLSAKLGVSRTPLRLAFEKLEHEGLVKALPTSGFAASEFSIGDVWDAIETRGVLEGAAARLAAERLKDPSQLEPIRKLNRAMSETLYTTVDSFSQYLDLNIAFHRLILNLSGSSVLQRTAEQVYRFPFASPGSHVLLPRSELIAKQLFPIAQAHHAGLVEAIDRREGSRAESLAREHSLLTRRNLEFALSDPSLLDTVPGARLINFRTPEEK